MQRLSGTCEVLFVVAALVMNAPVPVEALQVGVATVDITPPPGLKMWGYQSRTQSAEGAWDALAAKAVVFDDGLSRAAIVALDLGRTPPDDVVARIRNAARERHGIEQVLLTATHTHAAPAVTPLAPGEKNSVWIHELEKKIIEVIGSAASSCRSVTIHVGYGKVDISYDRRVVNADGSVTMLWSNPEQKANTAVDQTMGVVVFKEKDSGILATLAHFACHPVVFGGNNLKYSADFPAGMYEFVEENLGGTCLYIQGACGEINPYFAGLGPEKESYETLIGVGRKVGEEVVRVANDSREISEKDLPIRTRSKKTEFDLRYKLDNEWIKLGFFFTYGKEDMAPEFGGVSPTIDVETSILTLGDQLGWVGFPGEFFDDFQIDLRDRSPISNTFFVGYCNGYLSYFPTIEAASEGGYGAHYGTIVEVGAGEHLIDGAIVDLYEMSGRFR